MTPEQVLGALVVHSQSLDLGRPDPLQLEARDKKVGKATPQNWSLLTGRTAENARIELWPRTPSALGLESRHSSRHAVFEIAADALIGMYERNWHTLQVAIGIGGAVRPKLVGRLERIAYRLQSSERIWRDNVKRRPCDCGHWPSEDYVPDLCELAIRHLEEPFKYGRTKARFEWFGLSETHWHAVMARPYDQVAANVWSWYYAGIGHIQHRIVQRGHKLE